MTFGKVPLKIVTAPAVGVVMSAPPVPMASEHSDVGPSDLKKPIVEQKPNDGQSDDLSARALRMRIRQQELLAELGVLALQGTSFIEMLNHTARVTAEGLEAEYCKVLEYIPAEKRLLVRAGIGWGEGVVGHATVGADLASPAGYALHTGKPVISNHLENEERFRTPELLVEHGIRRAMNVILQGDGSPFGVLEVDSRSEGEFSEKDIAFLQGAANILGMAIEQQQYQRKLQAALARHQILLKEVNHRVKNSLQVVSSMLQLQANAVGNSELSDHLNEASTRISAVGRAYERLAYNADYEKIDLVSYLREVIDDLETAVTPCKIQLEAPDEIQFAADRAILVAEAERFGGERRRGGDRVDRFLSARPHAVLELLKVAAVRSGDGVRAEDDLQLRRLQRELKHMQRLRHRQLHLREPLLGVVADAEVVGLVLEIVAEDEVDVRIEVRPVLRHQIELRLPDQHPMLD